MTRWLQGARLVEGPPQEPVLSVDGAFGAPGLNLSHWPGNRTPPQFAHALSTGSALAFARLAPSERAALCPGVAFAVNNHFDTDGLLAAFAVLDPEAALSLEEALLDAASAGDFFAVPSERAFAFDRLVSVLADAELSPLRARFVGMADLPRRQLALDFGLDHAARWLSEPLDGPSWKAFLPLIRGDLDRLAKDLGDVAGAAARPFPEHSLLQLVLGQPGDPGRHALFATSAFDRVLVSAPAGAGRFTHRLVVGTRSWFDLPSARPGPRPALGLAAKSLAALEPAVEAHAWRHQPEGSPSPELWFGRADVPFFAEHNPGLAASRLDPEEVLAAVLAAFPRTAG